MIGALKLISDEACLTILRSVNDSYDATRRSLSNCLIFIACGSSISCVSDCCRIAGDYFIKNSLVASAMS